MRGYAEQMKMRFDERLQERTRLARDLHDTMLQTIQASKMVADTALDPGTDRARMETALRKLSDWLEKASEEGRAALESLRIPPAEAHDLAASLDRVLFECRLGRHIETDLLVTGAPMVLHPVLNDEVFRIAYEAVRNACVHSNGNKISVELDYRRNLTLRIADNGRGIDHKVLQDGRPGHYGLVGMRERAARIGARFAIESAGTGTVVSLSVPKRVVYTAPFRLSLSK
jgi:signal transduction histidine kinase